MTSMMLKLHEQIMFV